MGVSEIDWPARDERFNEMMKVVDFDHIAEYMRSVDWRWGRLAGEVVRETDRRVPTGDEIAQAVRDLYASMRETGSVIAQISSGGLCLEADECDAWLVFNIVRAKRGSEFTDPADMPILAGASEGESRR
jgi:hypothetical protein